MSSAKESSIVSRIPLWIACGLILIILVLLVALVKVQSEYLPLCAIAVLGVAVCWKWKIKGFAGAVVVLGGVLAYSFSQLPWGEKYWVVGLGMAIALAWMTLVFSYEEATSLIQQLEVESASRLENLWKLEERLRQLQQQWHSEREGVAKKLSDLSQELSEKESLAVTWEKTVSLVRQDLEASERQEGRLLEELFEKRTEIAQLRTELQRMGPREEPENIERIPEVAYRQLEGQYRQLREQFDDKARALDEARKKLFVAEESLAAAELAGKEKSQLEMAHVAGLVAQQLSDLERQKPHLQSEEDEENEALQSLVSALMVQLVDRDKGQTY